MSRNQRKLPNWSNLSYNTRKMHLFGVRLVGLSVQMNYMIDEDEIIGKLSLIL